MPDNISREARLFFIDTRFQKMARRPGGVPRERAIEQAQATIEEAKLGFDDWLEHELGELTSLIDNAKNGIAEQDWADIASIKSRQFRDIGTTMGFELLTFIADSLLEIFEATAAGAECNMESVMCHLDALVLVKQKSYRNLKPEQLPELTSGLRRMVECTTTCSNCVLK